MIEITPTSAFNEITQVIRARLVPMLHGSPGIGKSDLIKAIAKHFNLYLIDVRLSQAEPQDLNGFPAIDVETNTAKYIPMEDFPVEGREVPEGYNGWLLAFDEITAAPPMIQAASYKIILDRIVGQQPLHKKVACIAAGNLITDNAVVSRMSTALQSRMIHFIFKVDSEEWSEWAVANEIDHRIIGFLRYRPELVHYFDPNHTDVTFPCGRTWAFLSDIIKANDGWDVISHKHLPIIAGAVSEGPAREFVEYNAIYETLPTFEDIKNQPHTTKIPGDKSAVWAMTGMISTRLNKDNAADVMQFIERLDVEFQFITLSSAIRNNRELLIIPEVRKWQLEKAKDLV